jgi:hypothetical protein
MFPAGNCQAEVHKISVIRNCVQYTSRYNTKARSICTCLIQTSEMHPRQSKQTNFSSKEFCCSTSVHILHAYA